MEKPEVSNEECICNAKYITESKLVKNSDELIKAGKPEYVMQTRIIPNPYYKEPDTDTSENETK